MHNKLKKREKKMSNLPVRSTDLLHSYWSGFPKNTQLLTQHRNILKIYKFAGSINNLTKWYLMISKTEVWFQFKRSYLKIEFYTITLYHIHFIQQIFLIFNSPFYCEEYFFQAKLVKIFFSFSPYLYAFFTNRIWAADMASISGPASPQENNVNTPILYVQEVLSIWHIARISNWTRVVQSTYSTQFTLNSNYRRL